MKLLELFNLLGESEFRAQTNAGLLRIATENPNFRYVPAYADPRYIVCHYDGPSEYEDGGEKKRGPESSGCIFGQAWAAMGWDDEIERNRFAPLHNMLTPPDGYSPVTPTISWGSIQNLQDGGKLWGNLISRIELLT